MVGRRTIRNNRSRQSAVKVKLDANSLRRLRWLTGLFIAGLIVSGATAIPLEAEVTWLAAQFGSHNGQGDVTTWLRRVQSALREVGERHPFLSYGMDWLAFGHFVVALAFVQAWRDPVRHAWLYDYGLLACALVVPWALIFGGWRGIPLWWRGVDCLFGLIGAVPLWLCRRQLQRFKALVASNEAVAARSNSPVS
jgi:hypothetical protein